jgi:hypothetical protein
MSPFTLTAVFLAACGIGMWAAPRMIRRARESGYKLIDPRTMLAVLRGIEFGIFIAGLLFAVAIAKGLEMLK